MSKTNLTHQIPRAALTLLLMLTLSLTASASIAFITDVMVAGHNSQSQFTELIDTLQQQGWIDIEQDLNAGAGGDYIHLLLKTSSSAGSSGTAITGFYIKTGNNPPATLTHQGRTYYLVPYQGSTNFVNSQGDLNRGAGGDYIHLYYTQDTLSNHLAVSNIIFDNSQSGAIGANGGNTGYDLNSGCNFCNVHIFMHVTTAVHPFNQPQSYLDECTGGIGKIHVQGWTYDPDAPSESLDVEVYIYTDSDYSNLYMPAQLIHADVPRPDVNSYYNITGDHGFEANITIADAGDYWVKLYAIDHDGGTNPLIGSAAVTVTAETLVTLTSESGVVLLHDGDTLTGTGGENTQVRIADGATVTLSGVDITAIPNISSYRWSGITCLGDAVIVLDEGTTNSVKGGGWSSGIFVPQDHTLTLQGNGTLHAYGGLGGAGIGSGSSYSSCGNIIIDGGTVNATGGANAVGIGSGHSHSSCGNITITNGVTRVTATAGYNFNTAIGAGEYSTCGTVTIGGVQTGYITQSPYTTFPYTVSFNANGGTGTMDNMDFMYNIPQYLPDNNFTYSGLWFDGWATLANGPRVYYNMQNVSNLTETSGDTVTLYAAWKESNVVWLTSGSGEVVLQDGEVLTGTGGPSTQVKITYDATVTLSGVNITAIPDNNSHQWPGITCLGDAVIILDEGTTNSVKGGYWSSGIYVPEGHTLTLQGCGTLNANGGRNAAGIGSSRNSSCGNITISGGTVNATGGTNAAGIGSGDHFSCGDIAISGGTVTATGGNYAAGIGSGYNNSTCGDITISGGTVTANGGNSGAGIGSGDDSSSCGDITISGGTVTATGGSAAAGIGSGHDGSSCGDITINGGIVTSTGGNNATGIGSGYKNSPCGTVTISGGTVNATGGQSGAGIGSGRESSCSDITISGGTVTANGGEDGAGIGSGDHSSCGNITISGGSVNATGGKNAAGIGSGDHFSCGDITITNGIVNATGGDFAAGIGSGHSSSCGNIIIDGGTVTATGGRYAAGIGSGNNNSTCGNITIDGGTVTATGGNYAAGIGSGRLDSTCGNITITNGVTIVTAIAGQDCNNAIGVGNDYNSSFGTVTIDGVQTGFISQSPYTILTKTIAGYGTGSGGWQLIASPVYDTLALPTISNMIADSAAHYDLYRFDPSNDGNEWKNYKNESFNLVNGQGYLYANVDTVILLFRGTPYVSDSCEIALSYDASDEHKCWNLVGNPFNGEATLNKQYYILNAEGTDINPEPIEGSTPVPPCTAVFVKATEVGDRAVFSRVPR